MRVKEKLKTIFQPVEDLVKSLEKFISLLYEEKREFLPSLKQYLVATWGKKLRAGISFLISRAIGKVEDEEAVKIGAIVELIHLASLFHDDIIDRAERRRGMEALHKLFGPSTAVILGDYLYIKAINIAFSFNSWEVNRAVVNTVDHMLNGELVELFHVYDMNLDEGRYYSIIADKTASLFELSSYLPGIIAGESDTKNLREFGYNFGMAFQIIDDLLDVLAEEETVGKPVLSDLREGKLTLPYIYLLKKENQSELTHYILSRGKEGVNFEKLRDILIEKGAVDYSLSKAREFLAEARKKIEFLPPSSFKESLNSLLELYENYEF